MPEKGSYKTKQKEELLGCIEDTHGEHFTAADICKKMRENGNTIGTATVYRQLERLVDEGVISKYFIDESSSACFEYMDPAAHKKHGPCYHCKCEKCGRLIHMDCSEITELTEHLRCEHGFTIDPLRTVFYGVCAECATSFTKS